MNIVYIIGTFPSVTTTFIDREVTTLRQFGVNLNIVSMRRPRFRESLSGRQHSLQKEAIYLLPASPVRVIASHLYFIITRPMPYFKTLFYLLTRPHPNLQARSMTLMHFAAGVYAAHVIRQLPCDRLHAHFVDRAATLALVASRLLGIPYSLTAHANDIYVNPVLLSERMSEADFITTCTGYNRAYLSQSYGHALVDNKLHLIYHGLDTSTYIPPSHAWEGRPLLLSVGRLTEKKGFVHLIAACRQLKDRGYDFTCEIVGEGPLRQKLELCITQLRLEDRVTLCGVLAHEAVIEKYKQASLFVLPCTVAQDGDRDGIPNVLMEAMAMQLPVVSTDHSGIPELVENEINGLLVPPNDEVALTDALARLLDDPMLRIRLGQCGRQKVVQYFDATQNGRRLLDLFQFNTSQGRGCQ
jgi:glycosyltransferase involved in cell wall biosynthesis